MGSRDFFFEGLISFLAHTHSFACGMFNFPISFMENIPSPVYLISIFVGNQFSINV